MGPAKALRDARQGQWDTGSRGFRPASATHSMPSAVHGLIEVRQANIFVRPSPGLPGARRPFSWWVGPVDKPDDLGELLRAEGLEHAETELAMAADLTGWKWSIRSRGIGDSSCSHRSRTADFAAINAANWSPPDPMVLRFYDDRERPSPQC